MIFQYDCVNCPKIQELEYMIDNNREITLETFKKKIGSSNFKQLEQRLGYNSDFRLKEDRHVTYHSGKLLSGIAFVYLQHSRIEYIYY